MGQREFARSDLWLPLAVGWASLVFMLCLLGMAGARARMAGAAGAAWELCSLHNFSV